MNRPAAGRPRRRNQLLADRGGASHLVRAPQEVTMTWKLLQATVALTLIAAGAACDRGEKRNPEADLDRRTPDASAVPAALVPIDHSGVTGTVVADHERDNVVVTISVEGLDPGSGYPAFIRDGRCAAGGSERAPLGTIQPGEDGMAAARFIATAEELPAGQPWSVQVHRESGEAVACATVLSP
jgi:hypothetical protein